MLFINLLVILLYIMLALLSRKHYSKYKGEKKILIMVKGLWYAMADTVYIQIKDRLSCDNIKYNLRKVQVVSPKRLEDITKEFVVGLISLCLCIFFACNLISIAACVNEAKPSDDTNTIEREDYQGDVKYQDIYMEVDDDIFVYSMEILPVEYTEEEFYQRAEGIFVELETEILAENSSLEHVRSDLRLPLSDDEGIFDIEWTTDTPEYLSSTGKVIADNLESPVMVVLTATIQYLEYSASQDYVLVVEENNKSVGNTKIDITEQALDRLESENRNKKTIILPSEVSGVGISITQKNNNTSVQILLLGILLSGIFVALKLSRLKENVKIKCNMLSGYYAFFVNRLWLLLGTGMTIKAGLKQIISESDGRDTLIRELEYTINQIDSGFDEAQAYEQLGSRIGIPAYNRLMNHISRNLTMGTKNLRKLMEEEVYLSLEARKEAARKKGEQASTKLLFPMIILLATVMVILMVPAFVGF